MRFILGFIVGVIVGASIALALAPQSGAATRQRLWEEASERVGHVAGA